MRPLSSRALENKKTKTPVVVRPQLHRNIKFHREHKKKTHHHPITREFMILPCHRVL